MTGLKEFLKAQASSFVGGLVDYGVMIGAKELLHWSLRSSIACGGVIGAIVNFLVNRYWVFKATHTDVRTQLPKFAITVFISIFLKSNGTYFFVRWTHIDYKISRIIVDILVAVFWNYLVQKKWVFKHNVPSPLDKNEPK